MNSNRTTMPNDTFENQASNKNSSYFSWCKLRSSFFFVSHWYWASNFCWNFKFHPICFNLIQFEAYQHTQQKVNSLLNNMSQLVVSPQVRLAKVVSKIRVKFIMNNSIWKVDKINVNFDNLTHSIALQFEFRLHQKETKIHKNWLKRWFRCKKFGRKKLNKRYALPFEKLISTILSWWFIMIPISNAKTRNPLHINLKVIKKKKIPRHLNNFEMA